ncbi:flagellar motor switch phosphatase FliY [Bacillus sp. AGMB 02131]|uniref:Flagellar motor switch phosphatase FliY n=1 Tax=Peribacillus faecalis TaxID=2772559 RepID=A0A927HBY1_9BACI|nr:flagellar motor switch phosphatase FliY [Peribacillus faecalis]MBD3109434.1 flagellar motor switch phosphatase FliY [Peribacillus faecalis]
MLSEDMLSQDEIDALLKGTDDEDDDTYTEVVAKEPILDNYVNSMERDALGEIGNISFGSSATALSTLLNQKVEITTPTVSLIERKRLQEEFPHPYVAIEVKYTVGFSGANLLVIKQSDAAIIADLMLGGDGLNTTGVLGEIQLSAVQEAMNQMMGSAATSMSTIFNKKVDISPPSIELLNIETGEGEESIPQDDPLIKISFRLKIGELIDSNIMQLLPVHFAKELVNELLDPVEEQAPQAKAAEPVKEPVYQPSSAMESVYTQPQVQQQSMYTEPVPMNTAYNPPPSGPQHLGSAYGQPSQPVSVQPAQFSSFETPHLQPNEAKNLNMLLDIPLQVTVELGRTNRSVKDILDLSAGSIIELDKLAGEPVDILVNSRLVAKGEVVVIDENFGVRVTDILSQAERLNKLR